MVQVCANSVSFLFQVCPKLAHCVAPHVAHLSLTYRSPIVHLSLTPRVAPHVAHLSLTYRSPIVHLSFTYRSPRVALRVAHLSLTYQCVTA